MAAKHSVRGGGGKFVPKKGNRPSTTGSKGGSYTDTLTPGIGHYGEVINHHVAQAMRDWGKEAVAHMKATAPWGDRTGMARAGLGFAIDEGSASVSVTLYHSVSYGIWLEIAMNGEYAVIMPTIESLGPQLMHRLEAML